MLIYAQIAPKPKAADRSGSLVFHDTVECRAGGRNLRRSRRDPRLAVRV